jgi:hypothetical protein
VVTARCRVDVVDDAMCDGLGCGIGGGAEGDGATHLRMSMQNPGLIPT